MRHVRNHKDPCGERDEINEKNIDLVVAASLTSSLLELGYAPKRVWDHIQKHYSPNRWQNIRNDGPHDNAGSFLTTGPKRLGPGSKRTELH